MGNNGLCGGSILNSCRGDDDSPASHESEDDTDDDDDLWFYYGLVPGFLVAFLGFCGVLHFNKTWMCACF